MSVRTMAKVWADSRHAGSNLLMMLAIADFADDDGRAYPAVPTLAAKCRMKPRNANYVLSALKASGELEILINQGPKGANLYRIVLDRLGLQAVAPPTLQPAAPLQEIAPLQPVSVTTAIHGIEPLQRSADEPSLNHQEPPKGSANKSRTSGGPQLFKTWIAGHQRFEVEVEGEVQQKILRPDDPIYDYCKEVQLNLEFLNLHWHWFTDKHSNSSKRQRDWIQTFRNSVQGNWGSLWWRNTNEGVYKLTTVGKQAALKFGYDEAMSSGARETFV